MPAIKIGPSRRISLGDKETVSIDYTDHLDNEEILLGSPVVPTVVGIAISNEQINSAAYLNSEGCRVAANKAVLFSISADTLGSYSIEFTVSTDAAIPRTIVRRIEISVV